MTVINHPNEGASDWRGAFESLKQRGLKEVNLVVGDGLTGIENVITEVMPMATVQLCTVHLTRNILAKVKPTDKAEIANGIRAVLNPDTTTDSATNGYQRFEVFIDRWIKKYPSFKTYLSPRAKLYFNYLNYDVQIRRMIYTTNWIERLNRDYKRVLKMRSAMPDPESVIFLLGSVASRRKVPCPSCF